VVTCKKVLTLISVLGISHLGECDRAFCPYLLSPGDNPNKAINPVVTGTFGAVAGAASVFGNTPLDVIKTRMQVRDGVPLQALVYI
jgi:hypothetical protein